MSVVSPSLQSNNNKLYFSKAEISKIFNCYSIGVSKGEWKDYALNFNYNEAVFFFFKHSLASPDCILTKSKKNKKNIIFYDLKFSNVTKSKFHKIDDILALLRRKEFNII